MTRTQDPVIMVAESAPGARLAWRQYFVITDERCAIVEMVPAMLSGWKFHRVIVQNGSDWPGYGRDAIVTHKVADPGGPKMAPDLGAFRAALLAVATSGKLSERAP